MIKPVFAPTWTLTLSLVTAMALSLMTIGCSQPSQTLGVRQLEDPSPAVRIQAIKWAGDNKVESAVPLLVDRLQEQDPAVRFFAIEALKRITGADHGFDYKANEAERAKAVQQWRQALNQPLTKTTP